MTPATAAVDLFNVGTQAGTGGVYSAPGLVIFPPGDGTGIIAFYPDTETYLLRITTTIPSGATAGGFAIPGNLIVCNPTYGNVYTINSTLLTSAFLGKIPGGQYSGCLTANNVIFAPQGTPSNVVNFNYATGASSNVLALRSSNIYGRSWQAGAMTDAVSWSAVTWSPQLGLFVAIASTTTTMNYSTDGKNWSKTGAAMTTGAINWQSITWSPQLGLFVAVASGPAIIMNYSSDGKAWSAANMSASLNWQSVTWSPQLGLFVAVASGSAVMNYSTDGKTWTAGAMTVSLNWQSVTWSPQLGLFVAVASGPTSTTVMNYSSDGKNWTAGAMTDSLQWYAVTWSPQLGLFVAIAYTSAIMNYSTDGKNWSKTGATLTEVGSWRTLTWSPQLGIFLTMSSGGTTPVDYSTDGKNWSKTGAAMTDAISWYASAWSPQLGIFVAIAQSSTIMNYSTGPAQQQGIQLLTNGNVIIPSPSTSNVIQFDPVGLTSSNIFVGTDGFNGLTLAPNGNVIGTPNKSNIIVISPSLGISSNVTIPSANTNVFTFSLGACLLPSGNIYFPSSIVAAATNVGSANCFTFDPVSLNYSNLTSSGAAGLGFGSAILVPSGKVVLTPTFNGSYVGVYSSQTPVDQTFCASPYFNKS
jgi:hypothetical protein